jgi:hypothetical protein
MLTSGNGGTDSITPGAEAALEFPSRMTIDQAQTFQDYPVFWVGEEFEGLPVTSIHHERYSPPAGIAQPDTDSVDVVYGDCTPTGSPPTCVPPVQIQSTPYCLLPPTMAAEGVLQGESFDLRGASAQWVGAGHTLVLHTGESTVVIIATEGKDAALEVANHLRASNGLGPSSASEPLGPVTANCPVP